MRDKVTAILVLAALSSVAAAGHGDADAGGMTGRGGKGNGGAVVVAPGASVIVNKAPIVAPKPAWVNPFYPPPKPYPLAIQYPYYYYKTYPTYAAPVYPGYVSPSYVAVEPGQWVPGHWEQQWVPTYAIYQVWAPPYYDVNGVFIPGRWEDRTMETGGYYQPVWVEGYWTR